MKKEILRVNDLTAVIPGRPSLSHFCMYLYQGESLGIVGLHDSGKSEFLDCLMREIMPESGHIFYNEQQVTSDERHTDSRIFRIYQGDTIIPSVTVLENIGVVHGRKGYFQRIPWKSLKIYITQLMKELNINIDLDLPALELKTIERYEMQIIRGYMQGSTIQIIDELSNELTSNEILEIGRVIHTLQGKGISFLITGSRFDELQHLVDRCLFVRNGTSVKSIDNTNRKQIDDRWILTGFPGIRRSHSHVGAYETSTHKQMDISTVFPNLEAFTTVPFYRGELLIFIDLFTKYSFETNSIFKIAENKKQQCQSSRFSK